MTQEQELHITPGHSPAASMRLESIPANSNSLKLPSLIHNPKGKETMEGLPIKKGGTRGGGSAAA